MFLVNGKVSAAQSYMGFIYNAIALMSDAELRDDFDLTQQDLDLCRAFAADLDGRLQSGMAG